MTNPIERAREPFELFGMKVSISPTMPDNRCEFWRENGNGTQTLVGVIEIAATLNSKEKE